MEGGGVERKLSLGLVRSFFALSIGDNILFLSLPCLGGYHWLRTRRLLRLQKANSSLAPLPLLRLSVALQAAKSLPALMDGVSGRDAQDVSECGFP